MYVLLYEALQSHVMSVLSPAPAPYTSSSFTSHSATHSTPILLQILIYFNAILPIHILLQFIPHYYNKMGSKSAVELK